MRKITPSEIKSAALILDKKFSQAIAYHQNGSLQDAQSIYQEILKIQPYNFDALRLSGLISAQSGQYQQAVSLLIKAVKLSPNDVSVIFNLSLALQENKQYGAAVDGYDKVIMLKPDYFEAHYNRGIVLYELKQYDAAVDSYDKAIMLKPDYFEAHFNQGIALYALEKYDASIDSYNMAIKFNANFSEAFARRALTLHQLNEFDAAIDSYKSAIKLNPNFVEAHTNLGLVLYETEQFDAAIDSYTSAIKLNPNFVEAYTNLGLTYHELKRFESALNCYDIAIRINPDFANIYLNKAIIKILLGEYEEGWMLYEWRWKADAQKKYFRNFKEPLWLGKESIKDKTILVYAEQGLGDFIQFCRYIEMIEALSPKKIILELPKTLISLISTLSEEVILVEQGQPLPDFDFQCPIMSLPYAFNTRVDNIPAKTPYLFADKNKTKNWLAKLEGGDRPRIGIAWSGSVDHKNDRKRSLMLNQLAPLLNLPFQFHCLQKEVRQSDLEPLNKFNQIQQHQDSLIDFSDTAGLIENLDLVITVDTSIAHLAGAIGKKVYILLPFSPDYRWMLNRDDSPWYPSATLFRQTANGDWEGVIERIKLMLMNQYLDL